MSVNFGVQDNLKFSMKLTGVAAPDAVHGNGVTGISFMTKAEYETLPEYQSDMLYLVQQTDGSFRVYLGNAPMWQDPTLVHGEGISTVAAISQTDYDALDPPDAETLYAIT